MGCLLMFRLRMKHLFIRDISKRWLFICKCFIWGSFSYLCYFWTGLSLFFFPDTLVVSDYLFGFCIALIVNLAMILPLFSFSKKCVWLVVFFQCLSIIIYSDFLDGAAWFLALIGTISNMLGFFLLYVTLIKGGENDNSSD